MRTGAPRSVHVAAISLSLVISVQAALVMLLAQAGQVGWAQLAFAAVVAALLLLGILRGHRLAWLWGRTLGLALSIVLGASVAIALVRGAAAAHPALLAIVALGLIAPLLVMSIALSRPSAVAHFDLVCPECKATTRRGADFWFKRARCTSCGTEW